nr:unnamed protein product [Callosobruchus chinensis]
MQCREGQFDSSVTGP